MFCVRCIDLVDQSSASDEVELCWPHTSAARYSHICHTYVTDFPTLGLWVDHISDVSDLGAGVLIAKSVGNVV